MAYQSTERGINQQLFLLINDFFFSFRLLDHLTQSMWFYQTVGTTEFFGGPIYWF
jgi:hypothetical protein